MSERPNILFVFTDQQSAGAMSCAGNPDLHTPAMDRLAAEGVRFSNAYCAQPLCTPSRGSMMTGLTPHQAGTPRNGMGIRSELGERELGNVMTAGGYECVYGGKWHVPELDIPEGHGFRRICGRDDFRLPDVCADYLSGAPDRPFFMVASFVNPHDTCQSGRNESLPWGPIGECPPVEDCPNLPANFAIPPYEPQAIRVEQREHARIYPSVDFTDDDWRRYRWAYFRLVEKVDAQIGRILDALDEAGLADDTLVIFSSDHGDGQGAHRWNQKCVLYDEVAKVPLIVRGPGVPAGRVCDALVSNGLDLLPTLCDYAGVEPPSGLPGRSLRPALENRDDRPREFVACETVFDGGRGYDTEGRMIRTERYKYAIYNWGLHREQLFDMESDPGETVNLAVESRWRDVLNEHRRLLGEWARQTDDHAVNRPPFRPAAAENAGAAGA